jgi:hypothetical protein
VTGPPGNAKAGQVVVAVLAGIPDPPAVAQSEVIVVADAMAAVTIKELKIINFFTLSCSSFGQFADKLSLGFRGHGFHPLKVLNLTEK